MKMKSFKLIRKVIITFVLIGVFASMYLDAMILALFSIIFGMVAMSFFKAQITETIEDERINQVSASAASLSFKILLPILGLTSFALLYAGSGPLLFFRSLGLIFSYVTILGLLIYLITYWYFNHVSGG